MSTSQNLVFTEVETAKMLSLSVQTLRRMRADGSGPGYVHLGVRRLGYRVAAIEAWLNSRTSNSQPKAA